MRLQQCVQRLVLPGAIRVIGAGLLRIMEGKDRVHGTAPDQWPNLEASGERFSLKDFDSSFDSSVSRFRRSSMSCVTRDKPPTPPWRAPKAALIEASAKAPRSAISSAISRVAAASWSSGTTLLISPISTASFALIFGLQNQISLAFFLPT